MPFADLPLREKSLAQDSSGDDSEEECIPASRSLPQLVDPDKSDGPCGADTSAGSTEVCELLRSLQVNQPCFYCCFCFLTNLFWQWKFGFSHNQVEAVLDLLKGRLGELVRSKTKLPIKVSEADRLFRKQVKKLC